MQRIAQGANPTNEDFHNQSVAQEKKKKKRKKKKTLKLKIPPEEHKLGKMERKRTSLRPACPHDG